MRVRTFKDAILHRIQEYHINWVSLEYKKWHKGTVLNVKIEQKPNMAIISPLNCTSILSQTEKHMYGERAIRK